MDFINEKIKEHKNFVFIGEAGSGKSETALNFAIYLKENTNKEVHFFDLDMTKPLFRSRDACSIVEERGVIIHFQEQFMDAPTLVGGVRRLLKNEDCYVILDIGGDYIGARSIGGFSNDLNRDNCLVYYCINPYRPWSLDFEHIDQVLGTILGVSRIKLEKINIICNANLGLETNKDDVVNGYNNLEKMISPYKDIPFSCVKDDLVKEVVSSIDKVFPLKLYLTYPWNN